MNQTRRSTLATAGRTWTALAALLLLGLLCHAAPPGIACGSPADATGGHAWLIRPEPKGAALIWHIPPRVSGSSPGRARLASDARSMPVAAAAVGSRLYMIFEDKPLAPPAKPRQLKSISASPTSEPGRWTTAPVGRLETGPSFRADGRLLAAVGSDGTVWVLLHGLRDSGADPSRLLLLRLESRGWTEVPLPEEAQRLAVNATTIAGSQATMSLSWRLIAWSKGVGIVAFDPRGLAPLTAGSASSSQPIAAWLADCATRDQPARWTTFPMDLPSPGPLDSFELCTTGAHLVVAVSGPGDTLRLLARPLRSERPELRPLATLRAVRPPLSLAPLDADGVVAVFYSEPPTAAGGAAAAYDQMVGEVSARTGRIMYQGRVIGVAPVAPSDYRLMLMMMALVIGSVVLFIARPPGEAPEVHLPGGCSLAGPARRTIAAGIDVLVALVAGGVVWRVPPATLLEPAWWGGSESWSVCLTALALLVCGCTLCESLIGKTVGKALVGCEVVSVRPDSGGGDGTPATPAAALLRNLLKWTVPLIALVGLLDPSRRHRADEWASTAVIVRDQADETDP